jgi:hypothetical protein
VPWSVLDLEDAFLFQVVHLLQDQSNVVAKLLELGDRNLNRKTIKTVISTQQKRWHKCSPEDNATVI